MKKLWHKLKESILSVVPVAVIVTILALFVVPDFNMSMLYNFLIGAVMVIIGMALFTLGADTAMMPIGESMGSEITKTKKLWLVILLSLLVGIAITVAEPDLWVLARQLIEAINMYVLIVVVGIGVGIFLVVAMLRIIFQWSLNKLLIVFYGIIFILAIVLQLMGKGMFLPLSFDSGGVTTGPMTVPFIMAIGIGVAALKGGKEEDNFGLVALCSVGPIIAVMLLGLVSDTSNIIVHPHEPIAEGAIAFLKHMPEYMGEVGIALGPVLVIFLIFNFAKIKMSKTRLIKILIGIAYTYVGLVLFLTGVNVGFMPAGNLLGREIAALSYNWILIPIGIIIGFFIVAAEPAVHVLNGQVETISNGAIKKRTMLISLMVGVGASIGLTMIRVLTGISIWWLIVPGYAIAITLTFFVPKVYTAIAFDSGGVASGPMTSTFLLTFAIGCCAALGGNILTDAFGVVAMVAMSPLITIQLVGLVATLKSKRIAARTPVADKTDTEIIDLE